jgi:hypothetical protein
MKNDTNNTDSIQPLLSEQEIEKLAAEKYPYGKPCGDPEIDKCVPWYNVNIDHKREGYKAALLSIHPSAGEKEGGSQQVIKSALETLGHFNDDYAVGEGNIRDACLQLESLLSQRSEQSSPSLVSLTSTDNTPINEPVYKFSLAEFQDVQNGLGSALAIFDECFIDIPSDHPDPGAIEDCKHNVRDAYSIVLGVKHQGTESSEAGTERSNDA